MSEKVDEYLPEENAKHIDTLLEDLKNTKECLRIILHGLVSSCAKCELPKHTNCSKCRVEIALRKITEVL